MTIMAGRFMSADWDRFTDDSHESGYRDRPELKFIMSRIMHYSRKSDTPLIVAILIIGAVVCAALIYAVGVKSAS